MKQAIVILFALLLASCDVGPIIPVDTNSSVTTSSSNTSVSNTNSSSSSTNSSSSSTNSSSSVSSINSSSSSTATITTNYTVVSNAYTNSFTNIIFTTNLYKFYPTNIITISNVSNCYTNSILLYSISNQTVTSNGTYYQIAVSYTLNSITTNFVILASNYSGMTNDSNFNFVRTISNFTVTNLTNMTTNSVLISNTMGVKLWSTTNLGKTWNPQWTEVYSSPNGNVGGSTVAFDGAYLVYAFSSNSTIYLNKFTNSTQMNLFSQSGMIMPKVLIGNSYQFAASNVVRLAALDSTTYQASFYRATNYANWTTYNNVTAKVYNRAWNIASYDKSDIIVYSDETNNMKANYEWNNSGNAWNGYSKTRAFSTNTSSLIGVDFNQVTGNNGILYNDNGILKLQYNGSNYGGIICGTHVDYAAFKFMNDTPVAAYVTTATSNLVVQAWTNNTWTQFGNTINNMINVRNIKIMYNNSNLYLGTYEGATTITAHLYVLSNSTWTELVNKTVSTSQFDSGDWTINNGLIAMTWLENDNLDNRTHVWLYK